MIVSVLIKLKDISLTETNFLQHSLELEVV